MKTHRLGFFLLVLMFGLAAEAQDLVFESSFECVAVPGLVQISDANAAPLFISGLPFSPSYESVPFYGSGLDRIITYAPSSKWSVFVSVFANGTFFPEVATTIAAGSDNIPLPATTINVVDTTGFPVAGIITVMTQAGPQVVSCTGTTVTSFTGCTGGTGVMSMGAEVSLAVATPQGGSCAVDNDPDDNPNTSFDGQVVYRARETTGSDACYVRVCGECFGVEACGITRLPFIVFNFPVAEDDSVEATEATAPQPATGSFTRTSLTDNDVSVDPLSFALVSATTTCSGTVAVSDTVINYTGPSNPSGDCLVTDTFTYEVCSADITTGCDVATVTIHINRRPIAVPDGNSQIGSTDEDTPKVLSDVDLLDNDSDPDDDQLTVTSVQSAVSGSVDLQGGTITFTPSLNFNGDASFEYTVSDGKGGTDDATVSVRVDAVNDAPVLDNSKSPVLDDVQEDAPSPQGSVGTLISSLVQIDGLLDNVYDPDDLPYLGIAVTNSDRNNGDWHYSIDNGVSWFNLGSPSQNSARMLGGNHDTRLYFEPGVNFDGQATIEFRAWDLTSGSNGNTANILATGGSTAFSTNSDTATVTVNAENDPPISTNDSITILEDTIAALTTGDFGNYEDVEGTPRAAVKITTLESNGSLEFDVTGSGGWQVVVQDQVIAESNISDGRLRFVPGPNENGSPYATIGFKVSEDVSGALVSLFPNILTVNVTPVIDSPVINGLDGDSVDYFAGSGAVIMDQLPAANITDGDSPDFSNGSLTVTITGNYNDRPTDTLGILPGGDIVIVSSAIKNNSVTFANFFVDGAALTVIFNTSSTPALASAVLQRIFFSNSDSTRLGLDRIVTFVITDGDGGTSSAAEVSIFEAAD